MAGAMQQQQRPFDESNLRTPRTQLAMKSLGITAVDIQQRPLESVRSHTNVEQNEAAWKLIEQKRQRLLIALKEARDMITSHDLEKAERLANFGVSGGSPSNSGKFLASSEAANSAAAENNARRLQKFQEKVQEDIKKTIADEVEVKLQQRKRVESEAAFNAKLSANLKALKAKGLEREKKLAAANKRKEDSVAAFEKKKAAERTAAVEKTEQKLALLHERLAAKSEELKLAGEEKEKKRQEIQQKLVEKDQKEQQDSVEALLRFQEKDSMLKKRREEISREMEARAKDRDVLFTMRRRAASEKDLQMEADREQMFYKMETNHQSHQDIGRQRRKEEVKATQVRNKKRAQDFLKGFDRAQAEKRSRAKEVIEEFAKKKERGHDALGEGGARAKEVLQVKEKKQFWRELALENRSQQLRANDFFQTTTLSKVRSNKCRIEAMFEDKRNLQEQRLLALKEAWAEKEHVSNVFEKLKYTNNDKKFVEIVESLGVKVPPGTLGTKPLAEKVEEK